MNTSKGLALAGLATMVGSVAVALPASAEAREICASEICDPDDDTNRSHAPAFRDIVCNGILKEGDILTVYMEMAGPVPDNPPFAPGVKEIWWYWPLDLEPPAPAGYPFGQTAKAPGDLLVVVAWDGTEFSGKAIDRRPLLIGEDAVIIPVSFWIEGETVTAQLDLSLFEDIPDTFTWKAIARDWLHPPGTRGSNAYQVVDVGSGIDFGLWTLFPLECD